MELGVPHGRGDGPSSPPSGRGIPRCSPRAWGWTAAGFARRPGIQVFPTGVGMDRRWGPGRRRPERVPHGRGDGPPPSRLAELRRWCSPRAWGWTGQVSPDFSARIVFPTGVGMDRLACRPPPTRSGVPHGRGDGPRSPRASKSALRCSPRAWGWTDLTSGGMMTAAVFPTGVGMDRTLRNFPRPLSSVPHGRGDGPGGSPTTTPATRCSPRAWGWTVVIRSHNSEDLVFPTGVGMDRRPSTAATYPFRVPHGRGDGPGCRFGKPVCQLCSPRAWGWTECHLAGPGKEHVFPTGVGMDRPTTPRTRTMAGVPHGRGDGPNLWRVASRMRRCSPRAWGWTGFFPKTPSNLVVFPTGVGMDRSRC